MNADCTILVMEIEATSRALYRANKELKEYLLPEINKLSDNKDIDGLNALMNSLPECSIKSFIFQEIEKINNALNSRTFIPHKELDSGVVYPTCTSCGGRLLEVTQEPIPDTSDDLSDSMKGRKWLFSGDRCIECEKRVRGSYFEIK
jgi:hypothetical protein